jgi:hypothetical protein
MNTKANSIMTTNNSTYLVKYPPTTSKPQQAEFLGACLDTGAQRSVIGLSQAKAYCRFSGTKFRPMPNNNSYRFGSDRQRSLGSMGIRMAVPGGSFLSVKVDVVAADIPFLIGLDALDDFGLNVLTVQNILESVGEGRNLPLVPKLGHLYLEPSKADSILFTKNELQKLHRSFLSSFQRQTPEPAKTRSS